MQQTLIEQTHRIRIIDIIRGVAVLGIFTMNLSAMAYPEAGPIRLENGGMHDLPPILRAHIQYLYVSRRL